MPIYLKNKIVFIHIPKTGGTSVSAFFEELDDSAFFYSNTNLIGNHSPQHSTYKELNGWNLIHNDFKIISIVRHPYERFVSEFNYRLMFLKETHTLESFTKIFLDTFNNKYQWDNHNLSCSEFLEGADVDIIRYENIQEDFKRITGFELNKHKLKLEKLLTLEMLSEEIKQKIQDRWSDDFINFNYNP
jgi:hypothetical protein